MSERDSESTCFDNQILIIIFGTYLFHSFTIPYLHYYMLTFKVASIQSTKLCQANEIVLTEIVGTCFQILR